MNYAFLHCSYEIDNEQGHPHDSEFSLFSAVITAESLNWFSCWWCERRKWENKVILIICSSEKFFESRLLFCHRFQQNTKRHKWWIWMIFKNKQSEKIFFVSSSSSAWELLIIYQNCKNGNYRKKISILYDQLATSFSRDIDKAAGQRWFQTRNIIQ